MCRKLLTTKLIKVPTLRMKRKFEEDAFVNEFDIIFVNLAFSS
jgi:hypothetical protein